MLRLIFILNICLISLNISAQNWELFPVKQLNHYRVDGENPEIRSFQADSIITSGESTVHLFRNYMNLSPACYWQNHELLYYKNDNDFTLDSLIYSGDSVIYYFLLDEYTFEFVFKPWAKPGEQWDLSSHLNQKGTCISPGVMNILGEPDSIKTFSLQSVDGDITIVLSKSHGLIQFIPFTYFFMASTTDKSIFPDYNLIGTKTDMETRGFQYPDFSDYFHLSAGDLLLWKYEFYDTVYHTQYYRDSLLSSQLFNDSVKYNVHREVYNIDGDIIENLNTTIKYFRDEYENMLETPAKWFTGKNYTTETYIFFNNSLYFRFYAIDSAIIKSFQSTDCVAWLDGNSCDIACLDSDWDTRYIVSTIEGLTYLSQPYGRELKLLGSVIDGVERGSMQIPLSIETPDILPVKIFPNPAKDIIYLNYEKALVSRIDLYNSIGSRILSAKYCNEINVSAFPAGCYFLVIYSVSGEVFTHKLILSE